MNSFRNVRAFQDFIGVDIMNRTLRFFFSTDFEAFQYSILTESLCNITPLQWVIPSPY